MLRILRDKLVRLGKGEDGAALIVTLALFMFMYLSCAGVFSVGRLVRNRIHLQNACDAAAYSAAVVQADTLSRIATINRAMAWTYISMSKRQMDYIAWKWLSETVSKVSSDVNAVKEEGTPGTHYLTLDHKKYWALKPSEPSEPYCHSWDDEDDNEVNVRLNGNHKHEPNVGSKTKGGSLKERISDFETSWFNSSSSNAQSFYKGPGSSIDALKKQIDADKDTLNDMFAKEEELANGKDDRPGLKERIETTVMKILQANAIKGPDMFYFIEQANMPYGDYLQILDSSEESRFLGFADYCPDDAAKPFDTGSGSSEWFPLAKGKGFLRGYSQTSSALKSDWVARAWVWTCTDEGCECTALSSHTNSCLGSECSDSYFNGVAARPLTLTTNYFGAAGTITVGLACRNENPWYRILRKSAGITDTSGKISKGVLKGIYGAFNPYKDVDWTWAFSSAKAGYKFKGEGLEGRDYMVHWDKSNQGWNLCQSDLDAVFVPVRQAVYAAKATAGEDGPEWSGKSDESDKFGDWINGDWKPLDSGSWGVVASMPDLPGMHDSGGAGGLKWNSLADMLYH